MPRASLAGKLLGLLGEWGLAQFIACVEHALSLSVSIMESGELAKLTPNQRSDMHQAARELAELLPALRRVASTVEALSKAAR